MDSFDRWNELKKELNKKKKLPHFHEKEIWFVSVGENIGIEQNGKGEKFLRPVLIIKKFNKEQFLGLPLTKKCKDNKFYYKLKDNSCVILSQVRIFSAKRLLRKLSEMKIYKFNNILQEFNKIVLPHPQVRGLGLGMPIKDKEIISQKNSFVELNSSIRDIKVGKNVKIVNPSNLYECFLDDNVFIGPFVEIQKGVKIGKNTRIQSHTFICELVTIGENCFIGHGVMFVNDLFSEGKPAGDRNKWKETIIEDNVSIGSNATILPVRICSNVVIGAGSVVTKDIIESGIYAGNPARKIRDL